MKKAILCMKLVLIGLVISACSEDEVSNTLTLNGSDAASASSNSVGTLVASPSSVRIRVFEMWVSTSGDCSNPTQVYDDPDADYQEFIGGVQLGSGTIADGTYPCVIMKMSDNVIFTPAATDGNCAAGVEQTIDVCSAAFGGTVTDVDGTSITCDDTDQSVAIYLSTFSTSSNGSDTDGFSPPTADGDANNGFQLGAALSVLGDTSNTFIVDFDNKIDGSGAQCDLQPPNFSFE